MTTEHRSVVEHAYRDVAKPRHLKLPTITFATRKHLNVYPNNVRAGSNPSKAVWHGNCNPVHERHLEVVWHHLFTIMTQLL